MGQLFSVVLGAHYGGFFGGLGFGIGSNSPQWSLVKSICTGGGGEAASVMTQPYFPESGREKIK